MKKLFVITVILLAAALTACGSLRTFRIEDAARIKILTSDRGIDITDADTVARITDNITSLTYLASGSGGNRESDYDLWWYDAAGTPVFSLSVTAQDGQQVIRGGSLYRVSGGMSIDTDFLAGLVSQS